VTFTSDRGYAQFANPTQATQPTCSPTSGSVPQTVSCTNPNSGTTDMCYNFLGSPATDGTGAGCAVGSTKYTTSLSISSPETLYIVAGTSTLTDSNVVSYTYTSSTTVTTPCMVCMLSEEWFPIPGNRALVDRGAPGLMTR
jgi:hypothetical protein